MMDRETLAAMAEMDEATRAKLFAAARAYLDAPANLRAAIIEAGRNGDKPADIARAIEYAFTYDYVARLIRQDRGPADRLREATESHRVARHVPQNTRKVGVPAGVQLLGELLDGDHGALR